MAGNTVVSRYGNTIDSVVAAAVATIERECVGWRLGIGMVETTFDREKAAEIVLAAILAALD